MKTSAIFLAGLMTVCLHADTLHLRNGQRVNGTFLGGDRNTIRFQPDGGGAMTYQLREVDSLQIANYASSGSADRTRLGSRADRSTRQQQSTSGRADNNSVRADNNNVIPAGTVVTVRTIDRIDSDGAQVGESFRVSLDDPIVVNGRTIAAAGSDATIRVARVEQSGAVTGTEEIALELDSIRGVNRTFMVRSAPAEVAAKSRGQQSAAVIGGTAAVGAIIGAIAGGGRGAAIGAASGAGAGTAIQVIRGQRIRIEPESRLDFTISEDVFLQ
jgi:hypothetical protein